MWPGELPAEAGIQDVFRQVATDVQRTVAIADEVADAFSRGRKVLVLTERTDHIAAIEEALAGRIEKIFTLHGRMSKKQRNLVTAELDALPADAPRVLLATGKLVGEASVGQSQQLRQGLADFVARSTRKSLILQEVQVCLLWRPTVGRQSRRAPE